MMWPEIKEYEPIGINTWFIIFIGAPELFAFIRTNSPGEKLCLRFIIRQDTHIYTAEFQVENVMKIFQTNSLYPNSERSIRRSIIASCQTIQILS